MSDTIEIENSWLGRFCRSTLPCVWSRFAAISRSAITVTCPLQQALSLLHQPVASLRASVWWSPITEFEAVINVFYNLLAGTLGHFDLWAVKLFTRVILLNGLLIMTRDHLNKIGTFFCLTVFLLSYCQINRPPFEKVPHQNQSF